MAATPPPPPPPPPPHPAARASAPAKKTFGYECAKLNVPLRDSRSQLSRLPSFTGGSAAPGAPDAHGAQGKCRPEAGGRRARNGRTLARGRGAPHTRRARDKDER